MKPILTKFHMRIYRKDVLFSQLDKNSGCYDNLMFPFIYNGQKWKMAFIAILLQVVWQKFYNNIPWGVLYQKNNFCPNFLIWSVAMAIKRLNLRKNVKNSSTQKP